MYLFDQNAAAGGVNLVPGILGCKGTRKVKALALEGSLQVEGTMRLFSHQMSLGNRLKDPRRPEDPLARDGGGKDLHCLAALIAYNVRDLSGGE